jgi:hypothetical protein
MQHPGIRRSSLRLAGAIAFLAILTATLLPAGGQTQPLVGCLVCGERGLADAIVNILLFLPLGVILSAGCIRLRRIALSAAALSAAIELAQFLIPGRDPSVGDVFFNTSGAIVGVLLARALQQRATTWTALAATGLSVLVAAATGVLLHPALPASTYYGQWTPYLNNLAVYRGQVLSATLGDIAIPPYEVADSRAVREQVLAGATLTIRVIAGPPVPALAPIVSIHDDQRREIMLLGADRTDLVVRYRTRSIEWRLDQPDLRVRGALAAVATGDTVTIALRRQPPQYCAAIQGMERCGLGFTTGRGWALLFYPEGLPAWLVGLLDAAWVAGLLAAVGYYAAPRPLLWAGVALLSGLGAAPMLTGLLPTPAVGWLAGIGGALIGMRLRAFVSAGARATSPNSAPTS